MPELIREPAPAPLLAPGATRGAAIGAVARSLPVPVVTNAPIAERLGIDEEWIVTRTGVRERRIAPPEERVRDHASAAARASLAAAGIDPLDLDLVLVATMSHEHLTPNAAPLVAADIGAGRAGAIDLGSACTGFVAGVGLAAAQIEAGRASNVLVVGADLLSRITDRDDRGTAALFADGAGAALVSAIEGPGRIGPVVLGSDGDSAGLITAPKADNVIHMKGPDTFRHAVERLSQSTEQALALAGAEIADVDLFVYHQANSRIISAVGERLELPVDRVIDCVPTFGNTSAATIPIALAEADERGMLADGARVLLAAFGGGLTWGATLVEWGRDGAA
jgi:3-oxoacyl-[acyl-carrier-protein] synthase-3